jgi:hypothetical protein
MTCYEPADSFETPRFSGVRTFVRLPNVQDLENSDIAIVGAPSIPARLSAPAPSHASERRATEMSPCSYSRSNETPVTRTNEPSLPCASHVQRPLVASGCYVEREDQRARCLGRISVVLPEVLFRREVATRRDLSYRAFI